MEYIFGKNTILSFLEANLLIEVFLQEDFNDNNVLKKLKDKRVKITLKNRQFIEKVSNGGKHQGIVGLIKNYKYCEYEQLLSYSKNQENPFILMLDGIEDPHNFGAIIRTAEALGIDGIIIGKHDSCPVNATVAKVSTGAIANIRICEVTNLTKTLQDLKKEGYWIFEAEANQGTDYTKQEYNMPKVLVVGSEGFGISNLVKKQSDFNIFIPMKGKVNSLNVSVATAILLAKMVQN